MRCNVRLLTSVLVLIGISEGASRLKGIFSSAKIVLIIDWELLLFCESGLPMGIARELRQSRLLSLLSWGRDQKPTICVLLELIQLHVASRSIDDHTIALGDLNHVIVNNRDSLLITNAPFVHLLCLLLGRRQTSDLACVLFVALHILNGYARARPFRNRVSEAAQVENMQVAQVNTSSWLSTNSRVSLLGEDLFHFFLFFGCSWYNVKFWIQSAIRDSIVFHFDEVLQVVLRSRPLNQDGTPLHLHYPIVFNVHFPRQSLQHCCVDITAFLIHRFGCQHLILLMLIRSRESTRRKWTDATHTETRRSLAKVFHLLWRWHHHWWCQELLLAW